MKEKVTRQFLSTLKSIGLKAHCFLLLLKNLLLIRMLRVKSVSLYDSVVIEGNEVKLFWTVRGCHKIKVQDIGTVRGNIKGIKFKVHNVTKPIQVCFYGIARKKTEQIFFNGAKVNLMNKFYSDASIPLAIETPHNRTKLDSEFSNSKLETNFENIIYDFDSFDLKKYEPLKNMQ